MENYILITPVKDEAKNFDLLKKTVLNQTLKPVLWVIVDSNSSDNSFELAKLLSKNNGFIHAIKQKKFFEEGYGHKNFAQAINEGYEYLKRVSDDNDIDYKYIGKIDAAVNLSKDYFKILIDKMKEDPRLAFACGVLHNIENNKIIKCNPSKRFKLVCMQDIRAYRRNFFDNIGGYPLNYSPDAILSIKALNREWDIKIVEDTYYEKLRIGGIGGSKIKIWKAYSLKGKAMYHLGYDFFYTLLNSLNILFKHSPHYHGFALIYGYLMSFINKDEKIDDEEIREYFGNRLTNNLKQILKPG